METQPAAGRMAAEGFGRIFSGPPPTEEPPAITNPMLALLISFEGLPAARLRERVLDWHGVSAPLLLTDSDRIDTGDLTTLV